MVKRFEQWLNENRNGDDPRKMIDSILRIWSSSDPEETTEDLIERYRDERFDVLTLSQIKEERDIPGNSVIFSYQDDPSDLCYYKSGSRIFPITMGRLSDSALDPEDGTLEDLIGAEFNSEDYEDLVIALTPASSM